jgi:hypothetical protein
MIGKGMKDMTFGFYSPAKHSIALFSLVSRRSQILHFVAVRVKLKASALGNLPCEKTPNHEKAWAAR